MNYSYCSYSKMRLLTKNFLTTLVFLFSSLVTFFLIPLFVSQIDQQNVTSGDATWGFLETFTAHAESGWVDTDAWNGNKIYYDSTHYMFTTWFWIDGHVAYCCQPSNSTPISGSYWKNYWYNDLAAAILYFGYGGPGWNYARDNGYWPQYNADGGWMSDSDYYVATHILISYAYGSDALYGSSWYFRNWANNNLFGWVINNLRNNAWRVPERFRQNVYWMDPGWNTPRGWQGQDIVSFNWVDAGGVQINKKESKTNRNLSGINFGIYQSDQWGNWGSRVATITTDGNGNASTRENELPTGWYRLWEDNPPAGCDAVASHAFQITGNFSYIHNVTDGSGNVTIWDTYDRIQLYNTVYTDISVTKSWLGKDIPSDTKLTLRRNGIDYDTITINKNSGSGSNENNWNYTWSKLPKYDDSGNAYKYTVVEPDAKNGIVTINGKKYNVTYKTVGNRVSVLNTEVKDVSIRKTWVDQDNKYNTRPQSYNFTLKRYASGSTSSVDVETVTLNDSNGWKYTWANLPTVDSNNNQLTYVVTEEDTAPTNLIYSKSRASNADGNDIVFTNTMNVRDISVTKQWIGTTAKPSGIILTLKNGAGKVYGTATVTPDASGKWSYVFKNLPVYTSSGEKEQYTVEEAPVSGYNAVLSGNADSGFTIKNVSDEKISIPVNKTWVNTTGQTEQRPSSITVELYRDGKPTGNMLMLSSSTDSSKNWRGAFTGLQKYDSNGSLINYTVIEQPVAGYSWSVTKTSSGGFTVTNTYGVTSVTVNKVWNDNNNAAMKRPDSVMVRLLADGVDTGKTVTLAQSNSWKATFSNLQKYNSSGSEVQYTVEENDAGFYTPSIKKNADGSFTVTNTYSEGKTSVSLSKVWNDDNDKAGLRPDSVNFKLYKQSYTENSSAIQARFNGYSTTATADVKFGDAPTMLQTKYYNVTDKRILTRMVDRTSNYAAVTENTKNNRTLCSFYYSTSYIYDFKKSLSVHVGENGINDIDLTSGEYNLYVFGYLYNKAIGLGGNPTQFYEGGTDRDPTASRYLGLPYWEDDYTDVVGFETIDEGTFFNYPTTLCIDGTDATVGFEYSVERQAVSDLDSDYGNVIERTKNSTKKQSFSFPTKMNVVTDTSKWDWNTRNELKVTPTGVTTTDSKGNAAHQVGVQYDTGVKYLVGNGSKFISFYYTSDTSKTVNIFSATDFSESKSNVATSEALANVETKVGSFTASKGTHFYTVGLDYGQEESSSGWTYSQFYAFRDSADMTPLNDNVSHFCTYSSSTLGAKIFVRDVPVSKANNYYAMVDNLDKFASNDALLVYSLTEDTPEHYTSRITSRTKSSITAVPVQQKYRLVDLFINTATNTVGDLVDIPIRKTWNDNDNALGYRPDSITVSLWNETDNIKTWKKLVLSADNNWSGTFENLPYRNGKDQVIKYTAVEDKVPHYSSNVVANSDGSLDVINDLPTVNIPVSKTWTDANNEIGKRPAQVIMKLYYQTNASSTKIDTGKRLTLNSANNWSGSFTGLPKLNDAGTAYIYSVEEEPVSGYTGSVVKKTTGESATFTVTNKINTRDVSVKKVWAVSSQNIGNIPSSINVSLYADGVKKQTVALNASNNWAYTFTGLAFYNASGTKINYTVDEDASSELSKYSKTITGNAIDGFTIRNAEKTSIPVTKIWDDDNDYDGARPDNVSVFLVANGVNTGKAVLLDEANGWKDAFKDLDTVDKNGNDIIYTLSEEYVSGYNNQISGDATSGFTVTNSHEKTTTDLNIVKNWDDQQDIDKRRPTSISVTIYSDGTYYKTVTLNASDNWEKVLKNVPRTNANTGREIVYTAQEATVDGYTLTDNNLTGDSENGWTITLVNHHEPEKMSIPVRKRWYNAEGRDLPVSITVTLLQDGKDYKSLTLTGNNTENGEWVGEFTGIPIYKPGSVAKYTYSLREDTKVTGYSCQVGGDAEHGFVLTNVYTESGTAVRGVKQWLGDSPSDRPASITVRLLRDGVEVDSKKVSPGANGQWEFEFMGLPLADASGNIYNYTVSEDPVNGYRAEYGFLNNTATYRITNRKMLSIPVNKVWNDNNNANGSRPTSVTATLYAYRFTNSSKLSRNTDGYYPVTANPSNSDFTSIITFDGTVKTATLKVLDADGKVLNTVNVNAGGDANSHAVNIGKITSQGAKLALYGSDGKLLSSDKIVEMLVRDDSRTKEKVASKDLNAGVNWATTFDDLPVYDNKGFPFEYTVEEDPVYGYTNAVTGNATNGFTITNTEQTEIKVTKKWRDENGTTTSGTPDSIKVVLLRNGSRYQDLTLTRTSGYSGSFKNMPWRDSNGNEYKYEVSEDSVNGWRLLDVSGDTTTGFTVTNGKMTNLKVNKQWIGDTTGNRPSSIEAILMRTIKLDTTYASGTVSTLDGAIADYTSNLRSEINDYGVPTNMNATINVKSLNDKASIRVTLLNGNDTLWEKRVALATGDNDFEISLSNVKTDMKDLQLLVANITDDDETISDLYANGKLSMKLDTEWVSDTDRKTLNASGSWSGSFDDLPVVDNRGAVFSYDAREASVPSGYAVSYDRTSDTDLIIKNSYSKINVPVKKVWNDQNNADGSRPGSVTVELLKNGTATGKTITLNAENEWSGIFTELDTKTGSTTNTYTIRENNIPSGYTVSITGSQTAGFTVTNTHAGKTSIAVMKKWDDQNNIGGKRPKSITVHLFANGTEIASKIVEDDGNGNWKTTFDNLDYATNNGQVIKYAVSETSVNGYSLSGITGSQDDGFTITNWMPAPVKLPSTGQSGLFLLELLGVSVLVASIVLRGRTVKEKK